MNKKIYEALEYCLHALEDGADLEAVLARFPQFADELRPLLRTAAQARAVGATASSSEAMRLGRQRLLQRAAQLRPAKRASLVPRLQRLVFSLALALVFLFSGTGLVQASSSTLPGDNLYPVKRTWEDVRLVFVRTPSHRDALEGEYEQERLDEVSELLQKGRSVSITFSGLITAQQPGQVIVSGVPVAISAQTQFSGTQAVVGASVIVIGQTDAQGQVVGMHVQVLPPGSVVPLGAPAVYTAPVPGATPVPGVPQGNNSEEGHSGFHLEGTIQSAQADSIVVDGRLVFLNGAELEGTLVAGARVEVKGYFNSDGRFVATQIEVEEPDSQGGDSGQDSSKDKTDDSYNNGDDGQIDDNSTDDHEGDDHSGDDHEDGDHPDDGPEHEDD